MISIQLSMFREWDSLQARRTKIKEQIRSLIQVSSVVRVKSISDSNGDYCDDVIQNPIACEYFLNKHSIVY